MAKTSTAPAAAAKTNAQKVKNAINTHGYDFDALIQDVARQINPHFYGQDPDLDDFTVRSAHGMVRDYINRRHTTVTNALFRTYENESQQVYFQALKHWLEEYRLVKSGLKKSKHVSHDDWESLRKRTKSFSVALAHTSDQYLTLEDLLKAYDKGSLRQMNIADILLD